MELFLDRLSPGRSELELSESLALDEGAGEAENALVRGALAVDNMDQKVLVHGAFEVTRTMECHRCGEPVEQRYEASLELLILRAPGRGRTQTVGEQDNWVIHATHGVVDLREAVREAVFLDEPLLVRCAAGCDLEIEKQPTPTGEGEPENIDPRWEKLRRLREADEDAGREE